MVSFTTINNIVLLLLSLVVLAITTPTIALSASKHPSTTPLSQNTTTNNTTTNLEASRPVFDGWRLEEDITLRGIGALPAAVHVGRYIIVAGGFMFPWKSTAVHDAGTPKTAFSEYVSRYISSSINVVDYNSGQVFLPTQVSPINKTHSVKVSSAARLMHPVVGAHSAVQLGASVYLIGMCNMVPAGVSLSEDIGGALSYLLSVQQIRVLDYESEQLKNTNKNINNIAPKPVVEVLHHYLGTWATLELRVNASCTAFSNDIIAIVGGINIYTGKPMNTVSYYNVTSRSLVESAELSKMSVLRDPLSTPAVVSHSDKMFIVGGSTRPSLHGGLPTVVNETNSGTVESISVMAMGSSQLSHPVPSPMGTYAFNTLHWYRPQVFVHGRSMMIGGEARVSAIPSLMDDATTTTATDDNTLGANAEGAFSQFVVWGDLSTPRRWGSNRHGDRRSMFDVIVVPTALPDSHSHIVTAVTVPMNSGSELAIFLFGGVEKGYTQFDGVEEKYLDTAVDLATNTNELISRVYSGTFQFPHESPCSAVSVHSHVAYTMPTPMNLSQSALTSAAVASEEIQEHVRTPPDDEDNTAEDEGASLQAGVHPKGRRRVYMNESTYNPSKQLGYNVVAFNTTFSIVMSEDMLLACPGALVEGGSTCSIILSLSPNCNRPLALIDHLGPSNTQRVTFKTNTDEQEVTGLAVGDFMLVGSPSSGITHALWTIHGVAENNGKDRGNNPSPWWLRNADPLMQHVSPDTAGWSAPQTANDDVADTDLLSRHSSLLVYVCLSDNMENTIAECGEDRFASNDEFVNSPRACQSSFYTLLNGGEPLLVATAPLLEVEAVTPADPSNKNKKKQSILVITALVCAALVSGGVAFVGARREGSGITYMTIPADDDSWGDFAVLSGEDNTNAAEPGAATSIAAPSASPSTTTTTTTTEAPPIILNGKYQVIRRLGRGSFSIVFLVRRLSDRKRFALKYVLCVNDMERQEAMKECDVAYALQGHPHIIEISDMFMSYSFGPFSAVQASNPQGGGNEALSAITSNVSPMMAMLSGERFLSLVMAYHPAGDLGQWVRTHYPPRSEERRQIREETVVHIAYQVLSALHHMHSHNPPVMHRDLKPENILLQTLPSGAAEHMHSEYALPLVLTDFGLSRFMDNTFCETGVGSLPYVAPECWQRHYTTKADIWSLGCILYAVCSQRVESGNVRVMFSEAAREGFDKALIKEIVDDLGYSTALAQFIVMLLRANPMERPSAEEALLRIDVDNIKSNKSKNNSEANVSSPMISFWPEKQ